MLPAGKAVLHPPSILFYVHSQIFLIIMQFCPIYRVDKKIPRVKKSENPIQNKILQRNHKFPAGEIKYSGLLVKLFYTHSNGSY